MDITLNKPRFAEKIAAPTSKSAAHRQMIAAAFAGAPTNIYFTQSCEDIVATARCLRALGVGVEEREDGVRITPAPQNPESAVCDCGESGSTLRFLVPVVAALGIKTTFLRRGRLPQRPMEPLIGVLRAHGANVEEGEAGALHVSGKLAPGEYAIEANVSSQFVTGLLFALSLLPYPSTLMLKGEIESAPYINMTLKTLTDFKSSPISVAGGRLLGVPGYLAQPLRSPGEIRTEGDYSGAAFLLCAGAIGKDPVTVTGLSYPCAQGDMAILDLLDRFGAKIDLDEQDQSFTVSPAPLHGIRIDAKQIPDLVPVLAVVAAAAEGDTEITGAARLRLKESDRLATTAAMLRAIGGEVEEREDGLLIHGGHPLSGGVVDGAKDHRIVMSAAVAALLCENELTIKGAEAVNKSFPDFFKSAIRR
ncbi:MAG: 3-phosphoshikimate 1-carboxyvinyltransferase [Ruminococcaceae bacterium]|nr:3-phosphoshikimate 1-carboxyvinyltransferase [Oscillospiraceae bacterium]